MTTVNLNRMAAALKVHPRTVLRYLHNDRNYSWDEGDDQDVVVEAVAEAFNCPPIRIKRVLEGRDDFLKPVEAAELAQVKHMRTFWKRSYKPVIRKGRVTRFSRIDMINWILAKNPDVPLF